MKGKSKLGCSTCRRRKIKCDETFPACQRCQETNRKCPGPYKNKFVLLDSFQVREPSTPTIQASQLPPQQVTISHLDPFEARSLDYFFQRVAPDLAGGLDAEFWTILLSKVVFENRAICYAVLTISQLYKRSAEHTNEQTHGRHHPETLIFRWYVQSLSGFGSKMVELQNRGEYLLAMLSCVLFTNIEFQLNNVLNACNLLKTGLSLIASQRATKEKSLFSTDRTMEAMIRMFTRQRVILTLYGHVPNYHESDSPNQELPNDNSPFSLLTESRHRLCECLSDTVALAGAVRNLESQLVYINQSPELWFRQQVILENLKTWRQNFSASWSSRHGCGDIQQSVQAKLLFIYYEIALVFASACLEPEMAMDQYKQCFERIVMLSAEVIQQKRQISFPPPNYSFELGTIMPLFLTGWKCRDPGVRRKALSLLRQGLEQESLYTAQVHAKALEKVIELEEGNGFSAGTHQYTCGDWMPPERDRLRALTVHYETWGGKKVRPALIYYRSHHEGAGSAVLPETVLLG